MDRETTIDRSTEYDDSATGEDGGLRGLARDIVGLTELQWLLFRIDARDAAGNIIWPLVLAVIAAVIGLGTMPVVLLALAYALVEYAQWSITAGLATAAAIGLVAAGGIAWAAAHHWSSTRPFFSRSLTELEQNLKRVQSLLHPQDSPRKPR